MYICFRIKNDSEYTRPGMDSCGTYSHLLLLPCRQLLLEICRFPALNLFTMDFNWSYRVVQWIYQNWNPSSLQQPNLCVGFPPSTSLGAHQYLFSFSFFFFFLFYLEVGSLGLFSRVPTVSLCIGTSWHKHSEISTATSVFSTEFPLQCFFLIFFFFFFLNSCDLHVNLIFHGSWNRRIALHL